MERKYDFNSWTELEDKIQELTTENAAQVSDGIGGFSHLIFRGQGASDWKLETTLDREKPAFTPLSEYYRIIGIAKTQIETFTSYTWDDIDYPKIAKWLEEYDSLRRNRLPNYDFLVYLRHHGFPSPLLDWTRSIYIAAYFSFRCPAGDRIAIFAYQERAGGGKVTSSNHPQLFTLGPYVRSHPRHFLQQAEYTLCAQYKENSWHLANHDDVFNLDQQGQDLLWKFTLPRSVAFDMMHKLEQYNITDFSLFQSEESLLETLARQHIRNKARKL